MSDINAIPGTLPGSPPNGTVAGHTNGSAAAAVVTSSQPSAGATTQAEAVPAANNQPSSGAAPQEPPPSGGGQEASGKEMAIRALFDSSPIYSVVVAYLGLVGLIVILGALYFENGGHEISSGLLARGTGAIGAITGLLVPMIGPNVKTRDCQN